jgi:phospholipase/carboxylesterase
MTSLIHRTSPARSGSPPYPGIVLLHGLGSDELDLLSLASQLDPTLYAISVRAPLSHPGGGFAWYDLQRHGPGLGSESIEAALRSIAQFLDDVVERYPIDPSRLFLGGFSMGAAMAGALTLLHPEKVAGTVMTSGYLPPDSGDRYRVKDARGKPVFQGHGLYDYLVPLQGARLTRDYLQSVGVRLTYKEYPIAHQVSADELKDLVEWFRNVLSDPKPER